MFCNVIGSIGSLERGRAIGVISTAMHQISKFMLAAGMVLIAGAVGYWAAALVLNWIV
jgi:hypothetical protein